MRKWEQIFFCNKIQTGYLNCDMILIKVKFSKETVNRVWLTGRAWYLCWRKRGDCDVCNEADDYRSTSWSSAELPCVTLTWARVTETYLQTGDWKNTTHTECYITIFNLWFGNRLGAVNVVLLTFNTPDKEDTWENICDLLLLTILSTVWSVQGVKTKLQVESEYHFKLITYFDRFIRNKTCWRDGIEIKTQISKSFEDEMFIYKSGILHR